MRCVVCGDPDVWKANPNYCGKECLRTDFILARLKMIEAATNG